MARETPLEATIRIEGGRVLATLIRLTGDFTVAEDAVQDASLDALEQWPRTGVPANPAAWLTTVARRRAYDRIRRESTRRLRERASARLLDAAGDLTPSGADGRPDELRLLFTCCHPALQREAQVALTLRTLCRLTTAEIARAFLVPEPTMGQRISRAKKKIAVAHIPYRVPDDHELPERLPAVLDVIELVFTTGHHAPHGELDSRVDLADDALRLARLAAQHLPDEPEVHALLAMILATHARRDARVDAHGEVVLLADQDRSRWDHDAIAEAARIVDALVRGRRIGRFVTQAAIATLHGLATTWEETDWMQIAQLYALLERIRPTPVVRVNRAAAIGLAFGAQRGLDALDSLSPAEQEELEGWHLYWSARADFLRRLDRTDDAAVAYGRALACPCNDSDRRFLERRLAELAS